MNHVRVLMASAIVSALAACGGGGGDSASTANSTATASSSASATSNVTVNIDGLTLPAARQAVEQANESAGAAQQRLMEAQAALAAEQSRDDAAARQQQIAEQQAAVTRAQEAAAAEARAAAEAQAKLAAVIRRDALAAAAPTTDILDCSRNASVVTDAQTGLQLVCESQITSEATSADVGTTKHASGRFYALPFPDKTMIHAANQVAYKMACGQKICEWSKMGGSMDIVYAAQGKDGKYYRFTSCRKGDADRVICAYPRTGVPDGVDAWFDDREPEAPRIGAAITESGTSENRDFRAAAEISAPIGCQTKVPRGYMFPWPGKERFRQTSGGSWEAVFDGGNCLGDVKVRVSHSLDVPSAVYLASARSWPYYRVLGPDGAELVNRQVASGFKWGNIYASSEERARLEELRRTTPQAFYIGAVFIHASLISGNASGTGTTAPAETPAATPATSPATDSSGTTGTSDTTAQDNAASGTTGTATGTSGGQTDAGTGAGGTAAGTTAPAETPAATPATSPATDSSGTTGTSDTTAQDNAASGTTGTATGTSGGQTDAGTGAGGTAADTTAATGDAASA
ncbi:MAG: hypothetical protein Q4A16_08115 [Lautropia sp.]|nr:hypothetical protein [Lautropia sp.]